MRFLPPSSLGPVVLALFALLTATGCRAQIGDKCSLSTDCSVQGDRLCDTTQPGGYCTIFNCEPYRCPGESVCVEFHAQIDPMCVDPRKWPRFERTFCMRRCEKDSDCRDGYSCVAQDQLLSTYDALLVDEDTSICIPTAGPAPSEIGDTDICQIGGGNPMPSLGDIPYYDAGTDGGVGGAGGEAGAAGAAGSGGDTNGGSGGTDSGGTSGGGGAAGASGGGTAGSSANGGNGGMSGSGGASGGMSGGGGNGGMSGSGGSSGSANGGMSGGGGASGNGGVSGGGGMSAGGGGGASGGGGMSAGGGGQSGGGAGGASGTGGASGASGASGSAGSGGS